MRREPRMEIWMKKIIVHDFEGNTACFSLILPQFPTLELLLALVKERGLFAGERVALWKIQEA